MNATDLGTITINGTDYQVVDNEHVTIVYGDFLGVILDRFDAQHPGAGARAVAKLIEQVRVLDTDVILDLDGARSSGTRMATLDDLRDLIISHVLDTHYIAGAMAVAVRAR